MIGANVRQFASCVLFVCSLSPLPVQAASCSVSTAGLAFGAYDLLSAAPLTSSVTVRLTCMLQPSDPPAVLVGAVLSVSPGLSGSYSPRQMVNGTERMSYNVYTTNSYTTVWGNGTGGTGVRTTSFVLNHANPTRFSDTTGYGRVPALQDVGAGDYADSLVVSVDF